MSRELALIAGIVTASSLVACSSNGTTPIPGGGDGGADASLDAGIPETGTDSSTSQTDANGMVTPDGDVKATACTAPPFVSFKATVSVLDLSGTTQPLAGAQVGFSSCPGFYVTTDSTGTAATQITEGIALSPIYSDGTTIIGALGAEVPATGDVAPAVAVFAQNVSPSIPGFEQDGGNAATIAILIAVDPSATAPCNDVTGVTLAVTGHTEAVVSYGNPSWPTNPAAPATAPSTGVYVFINGITGASKVAVTGTKSGCTVNLATASQTGSFLLLPGGVTLGLATVTN
jgi:hypothetical protein